MKCPKCSTDNPKRAKFCLECGATLTASRKEAELETLLKAMQAFIPNSLAEKITKGKGQIEGERRFVTVMFADISGFTAMSELLDPEEVTSIMNDCYEVLAQDVYKYEGTIDKFIGDCIMVIFGAPVSHENDPERAVRCALEMQERIKKFNRSVKSTNVDLSLHIGINSGWVIVGAVGSNLRMDYTVMGDTVNLASKLESVAEKEQIYISQRTAELVKGIVDVRKLEPLRLKGKRKPVVAYEISGLSKHPRPVRGLAVRSEMVGREKEFALLKNRLNEIKESKKGWVLFITGEAGIGKSRLSEEIGHYTLKKGFLWVQGRCLSYGKAISYWVFFEMLRSIFGIWEMEDSEVIRNKVKARIKKLFAQRFEEVYPYILSLLSLKVEEEYQVKVKHLDAQALKLAQFCAVRDLFIALSQHKPVVIVFEDWQWADISSVELFEFMLNSVDKSAMLLLVVMREERDSLGFRVLEIAKKRVRDSVDVVSLGQLEKEDSEWLIKNLVSGIPETLKKFIFAKSKGNPFFVEEIIRSLIDSGALTFESGGWHLLSDISKIEIPDRIELLIGSRIDRLTGELKHVLQAASVIGLSFYYRILQYVAPFVEQELNIYLNHLEGQEFVLKKLSTLDSDLLTGLEYDFKHPLVQEVAYDGMLKKKRKKLHRKVGECIEEIFKDKIEDYYEILAYHYFNAEVFEKSYGYYKNAGDKAKELYQNDVAIECYTKAIEILNKIFPEEKEIKMVECLRKRAETLNLIGENEEAIKAINKGIELSKDIDDKKLIADCLIQLGKIYGSISRYVENLNFAKEALLLYKKNKDKKGIAYSLNEIGGAFSDLGDYEKALESFRKSLKISEEIGDRRGQAMNFNNIGQVCACLAQYKNTLVYCNKALKINEEMNDRGGQAKNLNNIGFVHSCLGDHEKALKYYNKSLKINEEIGNRADQATCLNNIGVQHYYLGDQEKVLKYYNKSLKIDEEIGNRADQATCLNNIGSVYIALGDHEKALKYYNESLKICEEIGSRRGQAMSSYGLGQVCAYHDQYKKALEYYNKSLKICEEIGDRRVQAENLRKMGEIHIESNDFKKAKECLISAEKIAKEIRNKNVLLITAVLFAELELKKNNTEKSAVHIKKAERFAEELKSKLGKTMTLLLYARVDTINRRWQNADKNFREAIKMYEELKSPFELAKAYFHYNNFLKIKGETQKAKEYLKKAEGIFKKLGAKGWLKKVEELIK